MVRESELPVRVIPFTPAPRPRVNFANHLATFPGQSWGPRTIPDCQFVILLSGAATLQVGNRNFHVSAGQGVFYGANTSHVLTSSHSNPMVFCSVHFDWHADDLKPVDPVPRILSSSLPSSVNPLINYRMQFGDDKEVTFPTVFSAVDIEETCARIVNEYRNQQPGYTVMMSSLLAEVLLHIARSALEPPSKREASNKVAPAIAAIQENPAANWTTPRLAKLCGYHPNYFSEVFQEATGLQPKRYLMGERIRMGKTLLLSPKSVEEIASEAGYSSVHYFCRQFKLLTGMTPTEFRRRNREL